MKINKLFIYLSFFMALTIAACHKDNKDIDTPTDPTNPVVNPPAPKPYKITEDFESGIIKTGYADATVTLSTGIWDFNDALIGNSTADVKDGLRSVRLRTGSLGMNFDISGITQIKISHAKYGNDASTTWQLMMSSDGGTNYTQVGSTINETSTTLVTDSFKVTTTTKVRFKIVKTSATVRVNIDDIVFQGTGDPGFSVGIPDTGGDSDPGTGGTSTAATPRTVTVGTDAPPVTGDNSNLLLGNPSNAQTSTAMGDNYLIDQGYYVESYNATRGEPNWVSWHLDKTNTTNVTDRLNNFAAWAGLPSQFFAVQSNSYSSTGFDRGHNCPSGDRTSSVDANSATFLMTNMIPQAPQNNQQTWNNLESYLRGQTLQGNEVYIIMGSYGSGGTGSNGAATTLANGKIAVPSNVWKVAIILPVGDNDLSRINANTRVIAVNTPNNNSILSTWATYITTVADIEKATGYTLLSALPQSVQVALKASRDSGP